MVVELLRFVLIHYSSHQKKFQLATPLQCLVLLVLFHQETITQISTIRAHDRSGAYEARYLAQMTRILTSFGALIFMFFYDQSHNMAQFLGSAHSNKITVLLGPIQILSQPVTFFLGAVTGCKTTNGACTLRGGSM